MGKTDSIFKLALSDDFVHLASAVQRFHNPEEEARYEGRAQIIGADGILAGTIAALFGFPKAGNDIPMSITVQPDGLQERWVRYFGDQEMRSMVSLDDQGNLWERMGIFAARFSPIVEEGKLRLPIDRGKVLRTFPLPGFAMPQSVTIESEDELGRFVFDVLLKTPFGKRIVHYRGWLEET